MGTNALGRLASSPVVKSLTLMGIRGTSLVGKFALTLFIAKFMGFESLGLYGLIAAVSIIAPNVLGLALMYTVSRKAVFQTREETAEQLLFFGRYIFLIYGVLAVGALVTGFVSGKVFLVLAMFAVIFLEHLNTEIYSLQLNLSQPFMANILHFVRSALWMLVFMALAFFIPALRTMEWLLTGWIFGSLFALAGFLWSARGWLWKPQLSGRTLRAWVLEEFRASRTMYVNGIATSASQYLNHFLITFLLGLELTGVYVFFMQVISAMSNLLQTGVIQFARPALVKAFKDKDPAFAQLYAGVMKNATVTATLMAVVAGPAMYVITHYLVDRPLAKDWFPVFWPMLVAFVAGVMRDVNNVFFYSRHEDKIILRQSLIAIGCTAVVNPVLLLTVGLTGVVLMSIFLSVVLLVINRNYIRKNPGF